MISNTSAAWDDLVFISNGDPRRETRWWTTQGLVDRPVYLMEAIKLHGRLSDNAPQLLSVEWCELRLLLTVFDSSMYVRRKLGSDKGTGTLVVRLIWDIRISLNVLDDDDRADVSQARACRPSSRASTLAGRRVWRHDI